MKLLYQYTMSTLIQNDTHFQPLGLRIVYKILHPKVHLDRYRPVSILKGNIPVRVWASKERSFLVRPKSKQLSYLKYRFNTVYVLNFDIDQTPLDKMFIQWFVIETVYMPYVCHDLLKLALPITSSPVIVHLKHLGAQSVQVHEHEPIPEAQHVNPTSITGQDISQCCQ